MLLYTLLTVLMFAGVLWSVTVGCAVPFVLFVVIWVGGEVAAGLWSPLAEVQEIPT